MRIIDFREAKTRGHLAQHLGTSPEVLERLVQAPRDELFFRHSIPKRNGRGKRVVWEIREDDDAVVYKTLLTRFHAFAEKHVPGYPSPIAHGYLPKHSILSNAHVHRGAPMLLNADIRNFFPSISHARLLGCLRTIGLTEAVAHAMSDMVTIDGQLVLGLPPCPMFANLICVPLDGRLKELARTTKSNVSRYGDDIAFSGVHIPTKQQVSEVVRGEDFELAEEKFRIKKRGQATFVTGLSVSDSERPYVPKSFKRRLRQELYYSTKHSIAGHLERCEKTSVNKIDGRIRFLRGIEPELGQRMQQSWKALLHRDGLVVSYAPRHERQQKPLTLFIDETVIRERNTLALVCVEVENADEVRRVLFDLRDDLVVDIDTPSSGSVLRSQGLHFTGLSPGSRDQAYRKIAQLPCRAYVALGDQGEDYAAAYEAVLHSLLIRRFKRADRRPLTMVFERNDEAKQAPQHAVRAAFSDLERTKDRRPPAEPSVVTHGKEDAGLWLADGLLHALRVYGLLARGGGADKLEVRNFERVRHIFRAIVDLRNGHQFTRRRPIAAGDLLQP